MVVFCLFFYSFDLPNNADKNRILMWLGLPDSLPVAQFLRAPWQNLTQRADLFGIALFVWAGALGLGNLALRAVRPPLALGSTEWFVFAMGLGLSATSLVTLGFGLAGLLNPWLLAAVLLIAVFAELAFASRERGLSQRGRIAPVNASQLSPAWPTPGA
jgi:hypothetical protein